jgi:hypothetical protein
MPDRGGKFPVLAVMTARWPTWEITPVDGGAGYTAHQPGRAGLWAATLEALDSLLIAAERQAWT